MNHTSEQMRVHGVLLPLEVDVVLHHPGVEDVEVLRVYQDLQEVILWLELSIFEGRQRKQVDEVANLVELVLLANSQRLCIFLQVTEHLLV